MKTASHSNETIDAGQFLRSCAAQLDDKFRRAVRTTGHRDERFFSIAGRRVKLTFASRALTEQLSPALEHVRAEPGPVELEVGLWEGRHEPAPSLPEAWERARYFPRGRVPGMEHSNLRLTVMPGVGSISLVDLSADRGWYCVSEAERIAFWESAAPLRNLFHAWLAQRGVFLLHAAAVGTESGAVLLVGKGGSGKSTTALLGLSAGMLYLGDDYCLCELRAGGPLVHALYSSAKVCDDALPRLSGLCARLGNPRRQLDEKAVFFLSGTHDSQLPRILPVRALLLPRISPDRSVALEPVSPGSALAALSPSTMMQLADSDANDLAFHAALARAVPAYRMFVNDDREAILRAMKGLLT